MKQRTQCLSMMLGNCLHMRPEHQKGPTTNPTIRSLHAGIYSQTLTTAGIELFWGMGQGDTESCLDCLGGMCTILTADLQATVSWRPLAVCTSSNFLYWRPAKLLAAKYMQVEMVYRLACKASILLVTRQHSQVPKQLTAFFTQQ